MKNKNLYVVETFIRTGDLQLRPLGEKVVYQDKKGRYRYCADDSEVNFNLIPDENVIVAKEPAMCSYGHSKKMKKPR